MGIIVNQENNRTDLQKRIATELADKDKKRKARQDELPDGVDDSAYIKGTKQTTGLAGVWIAIALIGVAVMVWLFIVSGNK